MISRLGVRLGAGLVLLILVAGVPAMLTTLIGWPLPSRLPSWDEVTVVLTSAPTERLLMNTLAVAAWAVWAAFVTSLTSEVIALARHGLADRHTQPVGHNPARLLALLLITAFATGNVAHSAIASAAYTQPATAVELVIDHGTEDHNRTGSGEPAPSPQPSPSRGYLWEDPPPVPAAQEGAGHITVDIAGQHHQIPVTAEATYWDLAEQLLGDPRRWPEIRDLNPHPNGEVLVLPHDATTPTTPATDQTTDTSHDDQHDEDDSGVPLTYEVRSGDWMWHIAGRFLDDEQRYPEIAALNPELAAKYPDYPDHIQPGDQLRLPADADDQGERRHATGDLVTQAEPDPEPEPAPEEPAAPPSASPGPPASPMPPVTPAPSAAEPSAAPPSSPTASASPPPAAPTPPAASPPPPGSGPGEQPDAGPADQAEPDDEPSDTGVVLSSGAWVSFGLAALIASAALLLRAHRRRRARLRTRPIPTGLSPGEPALPETLQPVEDAGLRVLNFDRDDTTLPGVLPAPVATPGAVGVDQAGGQVSLFDLPGSMLTLYGPGAESAVRAVLAAALGTGVSEHTGVQPRVIIPVGLLAGLLPEGVPAVGLDPDGDAFDGERLNVAADEAAAVTGWEEEMFHRRRICDQHDADTVGELVARDEHPEHLPPVVLIAPAATRYLPRLTAVAAHRHALLLHTVLLGAPGGSDLPGWRVDVDGTTSTDGEAVHEIAQIAGTDGAVPPVVRLSTLGAEELAAVLEVVRQVTPHSEPGHDDTEPAEADLPPAEAAPVIPAPAGDEPAPVKLRVLGVPQLSTNTGPITEGVRTGSVAVMTLLAAHPGGLGLDEIASTLHPGVDRQLARGRVHTDIDAARSLLRQATGITGKARFVIYDAKARRYGLDPDLVEVDLWRMLTCVEAANRAADDDQAALAALRQAVSLSGGDFAAGFEQAWALGHATTIRQTLTQAWARIAEILEADQPDEAVAALEQAIGCEPVNEELYRRLMRIHGRTGHPDRVRATLKLLERRLAELGDSEPSAATRRVADRQLTPPAGRTSATADLESSTANGRQGEPAAHR